MHGNLVSGLNYHFFLKLLPYQYHAKCKRQKKSVSIEKYFKIFVILY